MKRVIVKRLLTTEVLEIQWERPDKVIYYERREYPAAEGDRLRRCECGCDKFVKDGRAELAHPEVFTKEVS